MAPSDPGFVPALDVTLPALMADLRARVMQAHDLEDPALEDAFAHLAIDHPDAVEASNTTRRPEVAA